MTGMRVASEFFKDYDDAYDKAREMANKLQIPVAIRKFKEYGRPGYLVELYSRNDGGMPEVVQPGSPRVHRGPKAASMGRAARRELLAGIEELATEDEGLAQAVGRTAGGFTARGLDKHIRDMEAYSQGGEPEKALHALGQALFVLSGAPAIIGGDLDRGAVDKIGNELASIGSKLVQMGER